MEKILNLAIIIKTEQRIKNLIANDNYNLYFFTKKNKNVNQITNLKRYK